MKYNLYEKQSKSAKRVLSAFGSALLNLLCEKSFESLTVGEICNKADYPRATFYNYFDDKNDMLNYYWFRLASSVNVNSTEYISLQAMITDYVSCLYDLAQKHFDSLRMLVLHNPLNGYFLMSCRIYLCERIKQIILENSYKNETPVPTDILSEYYINTLLIIIFRCLADSNPIEESKVKEYLMYLIKGNEV